MKIAVITPYFKESIDMIKRCHDSVLRQQGNVVHFIISDGFPYQEIDSWDCQHMTIPNTADYGDTPRGIGAAIASALEFDAICFLDADNWYDDEHISNIIWTYENYGNPPVITVARTLYIEPEERLGTCTHSNGKDFVDTNCYFFRKEVFSLLRLWLFKPKEQSLYGDRIIWDMLVKADIMKTHIATPTVNYTTDYATHYVQFDRPVPPHARVYCTKKEGFISFDEYLKHAGVNITTT